METENDMIVETLLGLSGASDEHKIGRAHV